MLGLSVVVSNESEFNIIKSFLGEKYLYLNYVPQIAEIETGIIIVSYLDDFSTGSIGCASKQRQKGFRTVDFNDYFKL